MIEQANNAPPGTGLVIQELAELPPQTLIDEAGLAATLRVTTRTIRNMVSRFELPQPITLAGRSTWLAGRILDYLDRAAERAEREAIMLAKKLGRNIA